MGTPEAKHRPFPGAVVHSRLLLPEERKERAMRTGPPTDARSFFLPCHQSKQYLL